MKLATYNINGIHGRLETLLSWLAAAEPDVVCLQELKSATLPSAALQKAGYQAVFVGERGFNGVAVLSREHTPIVTRRALPGDASDKQARYLEVAVQGVLIACLYAPNGNPQPGPKFDYKLAWLSRLREHGQALLSAGVPVALVGDYNVAPTPHDIYKTKSWDKDALIQPESRAAYARLLDDGWVDAVRTLHPDATVYTFWDYMRGAFGRNAGLRLDHLLLSPALAPKLVRAEVDVFARSQPGSSDHAPVWIELDL